MHSLNLMACGLHGRPHARTSRGLRPFTRCSWRISPDSGFLVDYCVCMFRQDLCILRLCQRNDFLPFTTDSARMNSSKPGAEKINTAWITSFPTLTTEIQRIDGNEHGGATAHLSHHAAQSYLCQSHFAGRGSRPRRDGVHGLPI